MPRCSNWIPLSCTGSIGKQLLPAIFMNEASDDVTSSRDHSSLQFIDHYSWQLAWHTTCHGANASHNDWSSGGWRPLATLCSTWFSLFIVGPTQEPDMHWLPCRRQSVRPWSVCCPFRAHFSKTKQDRQWCSRGQNLKAKDYKHTTRAEIKICSTSDSLTG